MTTLMAADGRLLRRTGPSAAAMAIAQAQQFRPLWSDGETADGGTVGKTISFEQIYATQPAVAAAVNKLARQIATLPIKVYRRDPANNDRERLIDHPLEQLLSAPAPRASDVELKEWIAMDVLLHGNSLLAKYRADPEGPPTALLPVDWPHVSAYAQQGGPIEWWATTQTGEERFLRAEDSLHFKWYCPGQVVGVSPLAQLGVSLRVEDAIQRYTTASFRNGARPGSALVPPAGFQWKDGEKEEVRESIKDTHGGPDSAFKVALLGGGFEWKTISHTPVEAQLIQQRQLHREEVNAVYDVPGPLVSDLTHGTFSNVEELFRQFYKTTLRPWLSLIEATIQTQLVNEEPAWRGVFVEFDTAEVLRGSKMEEITAAVEAFTNGIMTSNEVRRPLNLPPIDDPQADVLQLPRNNLQPLSGPDPSSSDGPPPIPAPDVPSPGA